MAAIYPPSEPESHSAAASRAASRRTSPGVVVGPIAANSSFSGLTGPGVGVGATAGGVDWAATGAELGAKMGVAGGGAGRGRGGGVAGRDWVAGAGASAISVGETTLRSFNSSTRSTFGCRIWRGAAAIWRGAPADWRGTATGWRGSDTCRVAAGVLHLTGSNQQRKILRPLGWFAPSTIRIQPEAWRARNAARMVFWHTPRSSASRAVVG